MTEADGKSIKRLIPSRVKEKSVNDDDEIGIFPKCTNTANIIVFAEQMLHRPSKQKNLY